MLKELDNILKKNDIVVLFVNNIMIDKIELDVIYNDKIDVINFIKDYLYLINYDGYKIIKEKNIINIKLIEEV